MFFGKKKKDEAKIAVAAEPASIAPPGTPPTATAPSSPPEPAAASGKHPHHVLGQIAGLMAASPGFQKATLADLNWLALPAIRCNQVAVAEARDKAGNLVPVAAVVWAKVSAEVDRRLTADANFPPQLKSDEWSSGDIPWVVMAVGSEKACQASIAQISKNQLGGRSIKMNLPDAGGKVSVRVLTAAA